jgi:23S rRNA pseudouridine1911/1915/1917 synthase
MIERVPAALDGERVDRVVAMVTGRSRSDVAALIASGAVSVDGTTVTSRSTKVAAGEVVEVDLPAAAEVARIAADPTVPVSIVHEDADVVVVDKPAGLVVHPGAGNTTGTLVQGLLALHPDMASTGDPTRPGIVHRLDKGTSGLLAVARTPAAYEGLVAQLSARTVDRRYLALVWGELDAPSGMVDAPIGRSTRSPTRMTVSSRGREARTRYEVLAAYDDPVVVSLLECRLDTGRTHQIRVHLAAIGHPVVGDVRYRGSRQSLPVPRPWLHAAHLGFTHPTTGAWLAFDSPVPADIAGVLAGLA